MVALLHGLHQRYLDVKSSLFVAIEEYRAAFFYWALAESEVGKRIIDDIQERKRDCRTGRPIS